MYACPIMLRMMRVVVEDYMYDNRGIMGHSFGHFNAARVYMQVPDAKNKSTINRIQHRRKVAGRR